jgi:predicted  nucleic acid-binding Zn-ribbon protein
MQEMQESLDKLKQLKEDDKSEMGMLRSRIDDQSKLIMILKQRADEEIIRAQTLDRINQELTDFRDHADEMLKHEHRRFNQLEHRFHTLATNHEEMIKFKDEYKRVNTELREENARLKSENARLFSKAIQEKDGRIQDLEKKFATVKLENSNLEAKLKWVHFASFRIFSAPCL